MSATERLSEEQIDQAARDYLMLARPCARSEFNNAEDIFQRLCAQAKANAPAAARVDASLDWPVDAFVKLDTYLSIDDADIPTDKQLCEISEYAHRAATTIADLTAERDGLAKRAEEAESDNAQLRRIIERGRDSNATELSLSAQLEEQRAGNIKLLERTERAESELQAIRETAGKLPPEPTCINTPDRLLTLSEAVSIQEYARELRLAATALVAREGESAAKVCDDCAKLNSHPMWQEVCAYLAKHFRANRLAG